ncbi:unnamed protein product [Leuciscus chuanchicus]
MALLFMLMLQIAGEGNNIFEHLQKGESKQTEERTRPPDDEKKQEEEEKRETHKTEKVEVKNKQSKGKKRKASDASDREKKQDSKEERQPQTFDTGKDAGFENEDIQARDSGDCPLNNPTDNIKGIKVFGRLALTGQRKSPYVVTKEEIQRRIEGENMSSNVFRDLLGGRKKNLPEFVLNLPKKMKTKTSIFSALTEGEASDLATGLTKSLCQNVSPKLVRKDISDHNAEVTSSCMSFYLKSKFRECIILIFE